MLKHTKWFIFYILLCFNSDVCASLEDCYQAEFSELRLLADIPKTLTNHMIAMSHGVIDQSGDYIVNQAYLPEQIGNAWLRFNRGAFSTKCGVLLLSGQLQIFTKIDDKWHLEESYYYPIKLQDTYPFNQFVSNTEYVIGHKLLLKNDTNNSIRWLKSAALKGSADASEQLGNMYSSERFWKEVPKNIEEATKWYWLAVNYNPKFSYSVYSNYKSSKTSKVYWLKLAAEMRNASAIEDLGTEHIRGTFVEQDDAKALSLFRIAIPIAETSQLPSLTYRLGMMYAQGRGTSRNKVVGYALLRFIDLNGFCYSEDGDARIALKDEMTQVEANTSDVLLEKMKHGQLVDEIDNYLKSPIVESKVKDFPEEKQFRVTVNCNNKEKADCYVDFYHDKHDRVVFANGSLADRPMDPPKSIGGRVLIPHGSQHTFKKLYKVKRITEFNIR